jgi:hypothetical protein
MDQRPEPARQLRGTRESTTSIAIEWESAPMSDGEFDYLCEFFRAGTGRAYGFRFDSTKPE